jgi:formylglycine-generating enzyme required for sulfatase activity
MVLVPAGRFVMGSDKADTEGLQQRYGLVKPLYRDEHPRHERTLSAFYIDRWEVSNIEYKRFVQAVNAREPFGWTQNGYNLHPERLAQTDLETLRWIAREYFKLDADTSAMDKASLLRAMDERRKVVDRLPVAEVSWAEAAAYCRWKGKRLPTEAEWEKAARGTDEREFPWGNDWDVERINAGDNAPTEEGLAPVGSYEYSKSPYGAYDMAGNVWEWVQDDYRSYPGSDYSAPEFNQGKKVIRGGGGGIGHYSLSVFFRSAARQAAEPNTTSADVGFRCAMDAR